MDIDQEQSGQHDCNEDQDFEEAYQDEFYDNIDQYDNYNQDIEFEANEDVNINYGLEKTKSLQNTQYNMNELFQKIVEQCEEINKYTAFGTQWSMLYYAACGWKKELCQQLIGLQEKHKKMINFNPQLMGIEIKSQKQDCMLCCQENRTIIKGLCGDEFCDQCWKGHITERLKTNYTDPFPPCINDGNCFVKVAPKMCWYFAGKDPKFESLFTNTLCRSYSTFNSFVKICKGRQGVDCHRVFSVNKMLDVLECDTCGSMSCPRCGKQAHGTNYCYDLTNWKRITEQSLEFVQFLNYKICPNCKEAVERKSGCNSIVCPCKQQFCFVCGQKWLPNHSTHGDKSCYKYNEIQALNEQKKVKKQEGQKFYLRVEAFKSAIDILDKKASSVFTIRTKLKDQIIPILLENFSLYQNQLASIDEVCSVCMKTMYYLKGWKVGLYFRANQLEEMQYKILQSYGIQMATFLIDFLYKMVQVIQKKPNDRTLVEAQMLGQQYKANFMETLDENIKNKIKISMESAINMMARSD